MKGLCHENDGDKINKIKALESEGESEEVLIKNKEGTTGQVHYQINTETGIGNNRKVPREDKKRTTNVDSVKMLMLARIKSLQDKNKRNIDADGPSSIEESEKMKPHQNNFKSNTIKMQGSENQYSRPRKRRKMLHTVVNICH